MTDITTSSAADWLKLAEEVAEEVAERNASAAEQALGLNCRLAELGIEPLVPASTDGHGNLIPAQLTAADAKGCLYSVHAHWDEEEHSVPVLVGDCRPVGFRDFLDLKRTRFEIESHCDAAYARRCVVRARREGPFEPPAVEGPSADTLAVVAVLRDVHAALDNLAEAVGRR